MSINISYIYINIWKKYGGFLEDFYTYKRYRKIRVRHQMLGVSKKTGKPIKPRKPEKITEKTKPKKKPIKPITFFKKPAGSVSVL
jgi:hypothetical protein